MLTMVREQVASVLGHASPAAIEPIVPFKDLGFDSLGAVELRNRLSQASDTRLEATLVFDYPTPAAVAGYLFEQLQGTASRPSAVQREFDRLETLLEGLRGADRERALARLRLLNDRSLELLGDGSGDPDENGVGEAEIEAASDDELFELLDKELGAGSADDVSVGGEES